MSCVPPALEVHLMDEWRVISLGDLISLEYGASLPEEARTGSGFPVFGSNGVVGHHIEALVPGPGIIVGRKGSVGALQWSDCDFWPIDTAYWVRPIADIDLRWMHEALRLAELRSLDSSTGVPGLNRDDAYIRALHVPPLEEQRQIAEILDSADDAVRSSERVLAKQRDMRAGFSAASLRVESDNAGHDFVEEPMLSSNNDEYVCLRLSDAAASVVDGPFGSALRTEHYVPCGGTRVVRLANIGKGHYVDNDEAFIDSQYAATLSRHEIRSPDVVVASLGDERNPSGRACLYPKRFRPGIVKADCFRIRPSGLIDARYLVEVLNSEQSMEQVRRLAQGVTRDRINLGEYRRIKLQVPPMSEQQRYVERIESFDAAIHSLESALNKLRRLRAGLAEDLLSGRVRTVTA